jgi:hypothetical protein
VNFRCGHPQEAGNIYVRPGDGHQMCALCLRVRNICRRQERDQRRINAGTLYTIGERIARGIA